MNEVTDFFGEPISVYTSDQAEEDGILIKVNNPYINFITRTVFDRCIEPFIDTGVMTERSLKGKDALLILPIGKSEKVVCIEVKPTREEKDRMTTKLLDKLINSALDEIRKINKPDWMYDLKDCRGWNLWACQNEAGKFTLMFPEDY